MGSASVAYDGLSQSSLEGHPGPEARELAHDLLQPTATIAALVAAAMMSPEVPSSVRECLEHIAAEARHTADACRRVLLGGDQNEIINAEAMAAAVVRSARPTYTGTLRLVSVPVRVVADPVDLRRALANLVQNACRAAGPSGSVEVHLVQDNERVRLEVHDSGPGFGAGPRGVASLGLRIVRRVAAEHGGAVTLAESPLGGTCVRIELPHPPGFTIDLRDRSAARVDFESSFELAR